MLNIEHLSKRYKQGYKEALKDISFSVKKGEFIALLGQNGAGKTTLINVLAGNVKKTMGKVSIGGFDLDKNELETKKIIGIVPQEIGFNYHFTVEEILQTQSGFFGIKNNRKYIHELLEHLHLADKIKVSSRALSGGMKRRLAIAKALVHRPELLILDEPTAGVDIELRYQLYDFLNQLHKIGTTIILTTHYIEEAEKLCDRVIIIDQGSIVADDKKEILLKTLGSEVMLEFILDIESTNDHMDLLSDFSPKIVGKKRLQVKVPQKHIGLVFEKMDQGNVPFSNFTLEHKKLEDIYLEIVTDSRS